MYLQWVNVNWSTLPTQLHKHKPLKAGWNSDPFCFVAPPGGLVHLHVVHFLGLEGSTKMSFSKVARAPLPGLDFVRELSWEGCELETFRSESFHGNSKLKGITSSVVITAGYEMLSKWCQIRWCSIYNPNILFKWIELTKSQAKQIGFVWICYQAPGSINRVETIGYRPPFLRTWALKGAAWQHDARV